MNISSYNKNCQDDGPDIDDDDDVDNDSDDHLDPPHLHLGHTAFCLEGVKVGGQGEHHIALSHAHLVNVVILLVIMLMIMTMLVK